MKAKLLVFFGIVATGIAISVFTLTKCHPNGGDDPVGPEIVSIDKGTDPLTPDNTTDPGNGNSSTNPGNGSGDPDKPGNGNGGGNENSGSNVATTTNPGGSNVTPPSNPNGGGTDPGSSTAGSPQSTVSLMAGSASPDKVVNEMANFINKKNFADFMAAVGEAKIPAEIRERLKALIENPNLKLDPNRPFWEVAKTRDSVRWSFEFVPVKEGVEKPQSLIVDIAKLSTTEYLISEVSLPPTMKEVIAAIENPGSAPDVKIDSLNVAQAFSKAVLSEDFVSARKLCGSKVTDERIAGLMIALEEGKFAMREDRPLIVTFSRDTVSWVLSRVNSAEHSSEFALELEQGDSWMVSGLTFGKVIASLAREVEGPYSPIVEDPTGGESLVIYFDFDASGLTSRADNQLKIVASILKQDISRKIRITGHADALGSDDYNRALSSKRAESIRQAIIARGAAPKQVITEGFGESRPRKPNFKEDGTDNPTGRSENRRAEVYLDF